MSICFATLLQNELKSDVACFTAHIQTCFATNQVVAGCEKFLQKVESSSNFCNKICKCCVFYLRRRQTCLATSDVTHVYGMTPT